LRKEHNKKQKAEKKGGVRGGHGHKKVEEF
jgi:hypothetical protein